MSTDSTQPRSPWPRWLYLLRYHRPSQLLLRLRNVVRQRLLKKFAAPKYSLERLPEATLRNNPAFANILSSKLDEHRLHGAQQSAERIIAGDFCFLKQTLTFPASIPWRLEKQPQVDALWRFHLHYHEYLLDLAAADEQSDSIDYTAKAWEIVLDWIQHNQPDSGHVFSDAWHPFCISRRLPVWILLWTADPPPSARRQQILKSITAQANFLADHLETDLGGNHLLENLRALGFAGCFLDGPAANNWLTIAKESLQKELPEQITPHGEHFERSPMYHSFMLELALDLRDAAANVDQTLASLTGEAAASMGDFLRHVLHPDNDIPLLSDSSLDAAPPTKILLNRIEASGQNDQHKNTASHTGGYWTFRNDQDFLLFDAAPACPDHLPAHAHADLLNVVASVAGQRLFVDTGVYDYAAGEMRQHCRGTSAHNVLQIDNADQFDIWSRFRMGYRGWPGSLQTGQSQKFHWARATHNAYRRLGVPTVGRWLACRPQGPWLCLDWADGSGQHRLTQRLHLHPSVEATQTGEQGFSLRVANQQFELQTLGSLDATLEQGWYCPTFGQRQQNQVITWQQESALPTALGWVLKWPDQSGTATLDINQPDNPILTWTEKESTFQWHPRTDECQI